MIFFIAIHGLRAFWFAHHLWGRGGHPRRRLHGEHGGDGSNSWRNLKGKERKGHCPRVVPGQPVLTDSECGDVSAAGPLGRVSLSQARTEGSQQTRGPLARVHQGTLLCLSLLGQ